MPVAVIQFLFPTTLWLLLSLHQLQQLFVPTTLHFFAVHLVSPIILSSPTSWTLLVSLFLFCYSLRIFRTLCIKLFFSLTLSFLSLHWGSFHESHFVFSSFSLSPPIWALFQFQRHPSEQIKFAQRALTVTKLYRVAHKFAKPINIPSAHFPTRPQLSAPVGEHCFVQSRVWSKST